VVACQAENNIPSVGKEEVSRMREMHWLRIDTYFAGSVDRPQTYHQPVPCMHCENAPCEYVCPTGATTHSTQGLNEMTYNRCIGTRYCSNNCPYKVRRFNFFDYGYRSSEGTTTLQKNPDVTVRTRGVMEKCTYCVQRINRTRIEVEKMAVDLSEQARTATDAADRDRLTDEAKRRRFEMFEGLQTACQQSCPTGAIVFGDINERRSQVAMLKAQPHDYTLLRELTTRPRTSYLARVNNPNPAAASQQQGGEA
jgi:molybdopterin-containing oxidoreductase family iron-sulfur binding subunit